MTAVRDRVLVFDVNETLLDLGALDPHFARVFGDAAVRREWFATMLQSALLLTVTGPYFDHALGQFNNRDIKSAAAQVIDCY